MYSALSPHAIGVHTANLEAAIAAANQGGFGGVEFNVREVADLIDQHGVEHVAGLFHHAGLKVAGWGLPNEWRGTEQEWNALVEAFPRLARAAAAIGGTRTFTWIVPASDERTLEDNRSFHVTRLTPLARILAENGIQLGLEFIGPKTMRDGKRYPFIHTPAEMLAMGREIGPNVGLLVDCWHWHTGHGTLADLRALAADNVVYVHVNDAPAGIDTDAQVDNVRALPGETGVIDIAGFLGALREIGYNGPVVAEPFKKELGDLPSDNARLDAVAAAMHAIAETSGVAL